MGAFNSVSIVDGKATPLTHVFNPQRIDSAGMATFLGNQSVFNAKELFTLQGQLPSKGQSRAIIRVRLALPIMDTVDTTKKLDELLFVGAWYVPTRADSISRKDIRVMASNLCLSAAVTDAIENFVWQY